MHDDLGGRGSPLAKMPRSPPRRRRSRSRSRSASPRARRSRWQSPRRGRSRSRSRSVPRPGPRQRERGDAGGGSARSGRSASPPVRAVNADKKARDFAGLVKWGKQEEEQQEEDGAEQEPEAPVEKPNFGLSGALAKDRATGNVQNGVVMKWSEPPEARRPTKRYRLYVFKQDELIATLHVHRKSAFLVGRDKAVADILTEHASCSKQHAVLQFRLFQHESADGLDVEQQVRPYVMDLESTNGTLLNGRKIDSARYVELRERDVLRFGDSTREYVLMDAS